MKFPRHSRLVRPTQYRRVFRNPYRSGDRFFRVMATPNEAGCHRLGMAVSRKACGNAVERNRIKRIVRESFRSTQAEIENSMQHLDFVVLPTNQAAQAGNRTLSTSLSAHWHCLAGKPRGDRREPADRSRTMNNG